jgi:putative membrane protein
VPEEDELAPDALRRTRLANERTFLAWLRSGLTALAVALAVGKVVPDIANTSRRWPYVVLGVGYAGLGVALALYGARRHREVEASLDVGEYARAAPRVILAFAWATSVLGVGTAVLLIAS